MYQTRVKHMCSICLTCVDIFPVYIRFRMHHNSTINVNIRVSQWVPINPSWQTQYELSITEPPFSQYMGVESSAVKKNHHHHHRSRRHHRHNHQHHHQQHLCLIITYRNIFISRDKTQSCLFYAQNIKELYH